MARVVTPLHPTSSTILLHLPGFLGSRVTSHCGRLVQDMRLSRPTSPTLLPTLRVRGTSRVSFECLLSLPFLIEGLLASHQLHLPQVHRGLQCSLMSPERFRQDCVTSLRPCVCTAGYLQTCTCSQLPLSTVKCICVARTPLLCVTSYNT